MSGSNFLFLLMRDPWALLLFFLISLVPTGFFGWGLYVDYRIANEGKSIQAAVTDHRAVASRGRHGSTSYRYYVDYEFSPPGKPGKQTAYWLHDALSITVPKADYDRAANSERIEVLYIAGQPAWNRPKHCNTTDSILVFFGICFGVDMVLLVGVFAAIYYRRNWRLQQMQAAGGSFGANAGYEAYRDDGSRTREKYPVNV